MDIKGASTASMLPCLSASHPGTIKHTECGRMLQMLPSEAIALNYKIQLPEYKAEAGQWRWWRETIRIRSRWRPSDSKIEKRAILKDLACAGG